MESLPIIVLAGQSNMEGGDQNGLTPNAFTGTFNDCLIAHKPSGNILSPDIFIQPLQYGLNNNFRTPTLRFGPECGIAYYSTKKIGIIKYGYASTSLNWRKVGQGYWQCDADTVGENPHYPNLINNFVIPALAAYRAQGYEPSIEKFVWAQGEADAQRLAPANAYQNNLINLLNKFKVDIYPYDNSVYNMKVIITRTKFDLPEIYTDKVRAAQENVVSIYPNAYLIDSDNFLLTSDKVHYTRYTQANLHGKQISQI